MSSSELKVEVHAKCDECGKDLKVTYVTMSSGGVSCDVETCDKCNGKHYKEGYEEGFAAGKSEAERAESA